MKKLLLSFLLCFIVHWSKAQIAAYKSSVQFHVEALYVKADQRLKSPIPKYSLVYTKRLLTSRWIAEAGISYTSRYAKMQFAPFPYFFPGDRSQLVTLDLTAMYNLLKSDRHALRFGAGPSLWYIRNSLVSNLSGITDGSGQQLTDVSFTRTHNRSFDLAIALRGSYEYSLSHRLMMGIRASAGGNVLKGNPFSSLVGGQSTVGLSAGYRF